MADVDKYMHDISLSSNFINVVNIYKYADDNYIFHQQKKTNANGMALAN